MLGNATIIIPHYNDLDRLDKCLCCLLKNDEINTLINKTEIIVVDNNSPTSIETIAKKYPDVQFIVEKQKGAAYARNKGVKESESEYLFFIDADCKASPNWLETAFRVVNDSDIVGGKVTTFDESPPPRSGAEAFETVFAFNQKKYITENGFSVTANLLTKRSVFNQVGGFRNGVSEDVDWCHRAGDEGFQITYCPDLIVQHPTRLNWSALSSKWRRLVDESFKLKNNKYIDRYTWALRSMIVLLSGPAHVFLLITSPKLGPVSERVSGSITLIGIRALRAYWMLRQSITSSLHRVK